MLKQVLALLAALNYMLSPMPPPIDLAADLAVKPPEAGIAYLKLSTYISTANPRVAGYSVAQVLLDTEAELGLPPYLLVAIAQVESTFDHRAIGAEGERGLLQLHPRWHVTPDCAVAHCVTAGTYLSKLLSRFDLHTAIAAYNQGPNRPNPRSLYVQRVLRAWETIIEWVDRPTVAEPL